MAGDIRLNDLHAFDLTRTNGLAELRVHPQGLPTIILGYRLYELEGDGGSTSTVLVPGGGNFVVLAPQREVTNVGSLGTEFTALGTGVFVEQQFRRVSRTYGLHGPIRVRRPGRRLHARELAERREQPHQHPHHARAAAPLDR